MIKLISYEISGPGEVQIVVTDGVHTQAVRGTESYASDYVTEREFFAFGKWYVLHSELEYHEGEGTCCVARIMPA
jgi:hypothetical protein